MFAIEFTSSAIEDLEFLRKYDQRQAIDGIESQLTHQPNAETRNRKRLRPNKLAEWELRIGKSRAFYDVDEPNQLVTIVAVGYKEGNKLLIRGKEYTL
jgi:mRNA-degrading endonuclease RelE of RelBE toxin-antitoxin system